VKVSPADKKLDAIFSEYIRKRAIQRVHGCERCLTQKHDIVKDNGDIYPAWKHLQCSHFIGRGRQSVRFDEDNAVGLCGACHIYLTSHPLEHVEWYKTRLGQEFELLQVRMRQMGKPDVNILTLYYQEKLKQLG